MIYLANVTAEQFQVMRKSEYLRVTFRGHPYFIVTSKYDSIRQVMLRPCSLQLLAAPSDCQAMVDSVSKWELHSTM
jgi:hypothetical protein